MSTFPLILATDPAPATAIAAPATATVQLPHVSIIAMGEGNKGTPVILIPGLASPRAVWEPSAAALVASGHRVYLVQVNGFAGEAAGANLEPGIIAGIVADLHGFVGSKKLADVAVVGHSMGGLAGLVWVKTHPADIARLMVVDALPYSGDIFVPNAQVAMIEPRAAAMRDQMKASYGKPADKAGADATAAFLALKPESQVRVSAWAQASDPRVSGQAMYEDLTTDLRPDMAAIATPITLVYPWSAKLPREQADAFYRAEYAKAPHVTYVPIGDAAHFVMLDAPDAFAAALADFVK
ncbi:MAG: alpha/beta hydrolase [Sphingomonas sp.]|nr:alpha/beta hydrolase [Sphingomonas sp.]